MTQWSCVGKPTSRGGLPAYVAHFCFSGGHYVSFSYYSLSTQHKYVITAAEPRDEDSMEDEDDMDVWSGNQNRRLWKTACTRAALSVRFFQIVYCFVLTLFLVRPL